MTARMEYRIEGFDFWPERLRLARQQGEIAMIWVIDRFEGEYAVLENSRRKTLEVKRSQLPPLAQAGDALTATKDGYRLNPGETAKRKAEIEALTKDLWA